MYTQRLVTLAHDGADIISRAWTFRINLNLVTWNGDNNFDVDHGFLADHFSQRKHSRQPIIQAWIQDKALKARGSIGSGARSPRKFLNFNF